jgi:hypothetical protein
MLVYLEAFDLNGIIFEHFAVIRFDFPNQNHKMERQKQAKYIKGKGHISLNLSPLTGPNQHLLPVVDLTSLLPLAPSDHLLLSIKLAVFFGINFPYQALGTFNHWRVSAVNWGE